MSQLCRSGVGPHTPRFEISLAPGLSDAVYSGMYSGAALPQKELLFVFGSDEHQLLH
jgi:hypothetical protein